jgi:type III secretion protein J
VFIKYSPDYNLQSLQSDIRRLISTSIINLPPENISLMMQAAEYHFQNQTLLGGGLPGAAATQTAPAALASARHVATWWSKNRARMAIVLLGIAVLLAGGASALFFFGRSSGRLSFAGKKDEPDREQEPQ